MTTRERESASSYMHRAWLIHLDLLANEEQVERECSNEDMMYRHQNVLMGKRKRETNEYKLNLEEPTSQTFIHRKRLSQWCSFDHDWWSMRQNQCMSLDGEGKARNQWELFPQEHLSRRRWEARSSHFNCRWRENRVMICEINRCVALEGRLFQTDPWRYEHDPCDNPSLPADRLWPRSVLSLEKTDRWLFSHEIAVPLSYLDSQYRQMLLLHSDQLIQERSSVD